MAMGQDLADKLRMKGRPNSLKSKKTIKSKQSKSVKAHPDGKFSK